MTIKEYLDAITPSQRSEFKRIRGIVKRLVPDVEEVISYGIPTFKYKGKYILYFGAFKHHMSLFPGAPLHIKDKLKDYKVSKGTIQFTEEKPLPDSIIKEILQSRLADIEKD